MAYMYDIEWASIAQQVSKSSKKLALKKIPCDKGHHKTLHVRTNHMHTCGCDLDFPILIVDFEKRTMHALF